MSFQFISEYYDDERKKDRLVDFFAPETPAQKKAILFVHGGGYREGGRNNYRGVIRTLNEMGYYCASVGYRRKDSTILDMIADVRAGYRHFLRFLEDQEEIPQVAVFGTSAGAHLAGLLCLAKPGECGESIEEGMPEVYDWVPPIGVALQATPVTYEPEEGKSPKTVSAFREELVGKTYDEAPELYSRLSLVNYARPGACPVFMMEAELEDMCPTEKSMDFVRRLQEAGVRAESKLYMGAEHGFVYDVIRPVQREALADLVAFVESL